MVIDAPGMRELHLWEAVEGVSGTFEDVEALAGGCRFRDCRHRSEPGCAVRDAVERGLVPASRLESYVRLQDESRQLDERLEERQRRSKIISKAVKRFYKEGKKIRLQAENPAYDPILTDNVRILGKVIMSIRRF